MNLTLPESAGQAKPYTEADAAAFRDRFPDLAAKLEALTSEELDAFIGYAEERGA